MRVLFISSRFPQSLLRGDEVRAYEHLRELARRHAITLLAFAPDDAQSGVAEEISRFCERVVLVEQGIWGRLVSTARALPGRVPLQTAMNDTRAFRAALTNLLQSSTFDLAHVQLARMGEALPLLGRLPCVLDLIDALSLNMARRAKSDAGVMKLLASIEAGRLPQYERELCRRVAAAIVSSAADRAAIGSDLPALHIVANGIDPDRLVYSTQPRETNALVFSGNLGYFPNVDAATWFASEVLPLLRARRVAAELRLVGARPAAALRRLANTLAGVRMVGPVADMQPHIARAAVALAPMRVGSGQQIKILEAMACGTPVVATSLAAAGLDAVPDRDLLVADDARSFADAVLKLLDDHALAERLARNARALVEQRYAWNHSALAVERLWLLAAASAAQTH